LGSPLEGASAATAGTDRVAAKNSASWVFIQSSSEDVGRCICVKSANFSEFEYTCQ
jgi:hypothetical protein